MKQKCLPRFTLVCLSKSLSVTTWNTKVLKIKHPNSKYLQCSTIFESQLALMFQFKIARFWYISRPI